jgi:hypothetical protein
VRVTYDSFLVPNSEKAASGMPIKSLESLVSESFLPEFCVAESIGINTEETLREMSGRAVDKSGSSSRNG